MKDFGKIIYRPDTKAYVINNNTYTVPSPDDETVPENIHKQFDDLYFEIEEYAKENPDKVTNEIIEVEEKPLNELKQEFLNLLNNKFDQASKNAYINSSLGFKADANPTACRDIYGLVVLLEDTPDNTIVFCDYNNSMQELNLSQLKILQKEVAQNGTYLYQQKWAYRELINDAVSKEELNEMTFEFKNMSFIHN